MVKSLSQEVDDKDPHSQTKNFLRKRAWNDEEDEKLIQLVKQYGPYKWSFIASQMIERVGKQCRERWHNHLNPRIKKESWTEAEEWNLYLAHQLLGNKWADISKEINGRTDNSIKNHWNSTMRKKMDMFRMRLLAAIHLLKTAPQKFNKKFSVVERNFIKDIVKDNCLERKQPEKKNDRQMLDELSPGHAGTGPLYRDFKKLTVEAFNDEDYIDDLSKLATDNELSYNQMSLLYNFIEENEEEILAPCSQKERHEVEKARHETPNSRDFQTPGGHEHAEFVPGQNVAGFDVQGDEMQGGGRPVNDNSSSLLIPQFFINPLNLVFSKSVYEGKMCTPAKNELLVTHAQPVAQRYNIPSILKPMHDETADNSSIVSSK